MNEKEDHAERSLYVFGRDISQIPCFRNSFLYGIGGWLGGGILAFMSTSRPRLSSHIAFGSFFSVTIMYWLTCRYKYSKMKFEYSQIELGMRKNTAAQGTQLEKEVRKNAESV